MTHGEHIFLTKRCTTLYLTQHCGICILSIHPLQMWRQSLVNEREQRARRCAVDLEGVQHANEALHLAVVAQVYPKSSIFPNGGGGGSSPVLCYVESDADMCNCEKLLVQNVFTSWCAELSSS